MKLLLISTFLLFTSGFSFAQKFLVLEQEGRSSRQHLISRGNIVSIQFKGNKNDRSMMTPLGYRHRNLNFVQGRVRSLNDSVIMVSPLLSRRTFSVEIDKIARIKREFMGVQTAIIGTMSLGTIYAMNRISGPVPALVFGGIYAGVTGFLWNGAINPMKNVDKSYYRSNNRYHLQFIDFQREARE
jgi:hypothetical protein